MNTDTNKSEVIEQIRKVMRLANRAGSEGEKAAAEAAASRLASRHGINLEDIEPGDSKIVTTVVSDGTVYRDVASIMPYVTAVLHNHFGVIPIQHRCGRGSRTIRWVGTAINIEIARHVFHILVREFNKAWGDAATARSYARELAADRSGYVDPRRQRALVKLSKINRAAFMDGWFYSIHEKLRIFPLRNDMDQFRAEKKAAEDMLSRMKEAKNIKDMTQNKKLNKDELMAAGMGAIAGQSISLNRTAGGTPSNRTMLS